MPEYPDKRNRFSNLQPTDFSLPVKRAYRESAPREHFRVTTDPNRIVEAPQPVPEPPKEDAVPDSSEWEL